MCAVGSTPNCGPGSKISGLTRIVLRASPPSVLPHCWNHRSLGLAIWWSPLCVSNNIWQIRIAEALRAVPEASGPGPPSQLFFQCTFLVSFLRVKSLKFRFKCASGQSEVQDTVLQYFFLFWLSHRNGTVGTFCFVTNPRF